MLHFRVLPTDPKYQALNLVQKVILGEALTRHRSELFELGSDFFEMLKPWLNYELYSHVKSVEENRRENAFFDDLTKTSDRFEMPAELQKVIEEGKRKMKETGQDA